MFLLVGSDWFGLRSIAMVVVVVLIYVVELPCRWPGTCDYWLLVD